MKVLVCGSRDWTDEGKIVERLVKLPRGTEIISGGARGADQLAATIGRGLGFNVTEFPAEWRDRDNLYRPWAGKERNLRMLDENPDLVIAFWKNGSTGTLHTKSNAEARGIEVEVIEA